MTRERYTRYPRAILWLVREGRVRIGGAGAEEQPSFLARVSSFYISKAPITNLQYEAYDPAHDRPPASPGDDDPVVGVDHRDAAGYCKWYARVANKPIRLPTEVEWEYACRGGSETRCFFGDDVRRGDDFMWDAENSGERLPRLTDKRPNPFGLVGMLGGVWEWTSSLYLPYPPTEGDGRDDPDRDGRRVLRGGSFRTEREQLGSGVRRGAPPDFLRDDIGFRIARSFDA